MDDNKQQNNIYDEQQNSTYNNQQQYFAGQDNQQINAGEPISIDGFDPIQDASTGFKVSLISLIAAIVSIWILLRFDYAIGSVFIAIVAAWGIDSSKKGMSSSKRGIAISGFVMGIIAEIISVCMILLVIALKILGIIWS